jgi:hypothetical protein
VAQPHTKVALGSPEARPCRTPVGSAQLKEKEHTVNRGLKSTPVIASALATFIMTAPTGSQANPAENLQVSSGQTELGFSQAAAEAIKTKAENTQIARAPSKGWTKVQWINFGDPGEEPVITR